MKIEPSSFQAFVISNAPSAPNRGVLDPVTVLLQDLKGQGRIIVECYGAAWSGWFGAYAGASLRDFISRCDAPYLAERLARVQYRSAIESDEAQALRIAEAVIDALKNHATATTVALGGTPTCAWTYDEDDCIYSTSCGNAFLFDTGGIKENRARYCCYCGKTILPVEPTGESDVA